MQILPFSFFTGNTACGRMDIFPAGARNGLELKHQVIVIALFIAADDDDIALAVLRLQLACDNLVAGDLPTARTLEGLFVDALLEETRAAFGAVAFAGCVVRRLGRVDDDGELSVALGIGIMIVGDGFVITIPNIVLAGFI